MALSKIQGIEGQVTPNLGRRNMLYNGAMQVAQRGTSSTSDGYATVDRFFTYKESCEQLAVTQTQSTTAPAGFSSSYKLDVTTAETATEANDQYEIVTRLEGQDLQHLQHNSSDAKSVTLSFWVRSSKTGTYCVALYKRDSTRNITSTYAISSANTWEKKTVTFVGDTSGAIDNDANRSLDISWKLLIGSNFTGTASTTWGATTDARSANGHTATWGSSTSDDFYLTGVQLEVGDTATEFEHLPYTQDLALCQRYFEILISVPKAINAAQLIGESYNSTRNFTKIFMKVTKRGFCTIAQANVAGTVYQNGGGASVSAMPNVYGNDTSSIGLDFTANRSAGSAFHLDLSGTTLVTADAEL